MADQASMKQYVRARRHRKKKVKGKRKVKKGY